MMALPGTNGVTFANFFTSRGLSCFILKWGEYLLRCYLAESVGKKEKHPLSLRIMAVAKCILNITNNNNDDNNNTLNVWG